MSYVEHKSLIGFEVILTEVKQSLKGYFEKGSTVKIIDCDSKRGYTFEDKEGNKITENGFSGFTLVNDKD